MSRKGSGSCLATAAENEGSSALSESNFERASSRIELFSLWELENALSTELKISLFMDSEESYEFDNATFAIGRVESAFANVLMRLLLRRLVTTPCNSDHGW